MSMIVALDVDGILGDFDTHWRECAEKVVGRSLPKISDQHSMGDRYGLTKEEVDAVWQEFHAQWDSLPMYDHAHDLVAALEELDCQVWAVTSIDEQHLASRAESLAGLIPAGRIVCVGAHGTDHALNAVAKTNALRDIGAVAFLDDHPANVNAALGVVGLSVLLDRGYHGLEDPEHDVTVIDDPMDFPVLVESYLKRTGKMVWPVTFGGNWFCNAASPYDGIGWGYPMDGGRLTFTANVWLPDVSLMATGAAANPQLSGNLIKIRVKPAIHGWEG